MSSARTRIGGFTLIELLLATAVFAILSAAMFSVLHGAVQLREHAAETFAQDRPQQYAAALIERDLRNMLPPAGVMAGDMVGENNEETDRDLDTLEFYTTTGTITDDLPWGDMLHVTYSLEEPEDEDNDEETYDLVRTVKRNLLASTEEDEEEDDEDDDDGEGEERLLRGVTSLEFSYFDGEEWQDSWDTSMDDEGLPEAISVRIDFAEPEDGTTAKAPIEVLQEIVCAATTTEEFTTEAESS